MLQEQSVGFAHSEEGAPGDQFPYRWRPEKLQMHFRLHSMESRTSLIGKVLLYPNSGFG